MNSVTQFAETIQRVIGEEVEQLAREVGFIQRERVLSGADFVQSLILGWLQEPEITLDGLTQVLQRREVSISASGLSQRFTQEAATLLRRVLERLSAQQMQVEPVEMALLKQWSRGDPGRQFHHHLAPPIGRGVARLRGRALEPAKQLSSCLCAGMCCGESCKDPGSSRVDATTSVGRWRHVTCPMAACMWLTWAFSGWGA